MRPIDSTEIPWQFHSSVLLTASASLSETDISSKTSVISATTPLLFTISQSTLSGNEAEDPGTDRQISLLTLLFRSGRPETNLKIAGKQTRIESWRAPLDLHIVRYSFQKNLFITPPHGKSNRATKPPEQVCWFNKGEVCVRIRESWIKRI